MTKRKWTVPTISPVLGFAAVLIVAIIWVGLIGALKIVQRNLNSGRPQIEMVQTVNQPITFDAPAFSFTDQDGKRLTQNDLKGRVWIADFFYTQCVSACPVLTSKLILLQQKLKNTNVRFISFSVDPENDTTPALKSYAKLWQGDETRWTLLRTDPTGLAAVAAGFKVAVGPGDSKDNPILHSSLFMLIDQNGKVRGLFDSIDNQSMLDLIEQAKALEGNPTAGGTEALTTGTTSIDRGRNLFGSMGCAACHSNARIAPPLQGLYGGQVRLDHRQTVWADDAYLHESIVDPNAKIVAGYTRTMPSYQSFLNNAQVLDLVNYIKSLSTNPPGGHGLASTSTTLPDESELMIDPICKMQVRAGADTPHCMDQGKTIYFCSDHCKEQFLAQRKITAPGNYSH